MRNINAVPTVEQTVEVACPGFDWDLSLRRPETHEALARRFGVVRPPIGYARYAGTVAHRAVEDQFLTDIGAPVGYSARLTNSGMSAITTAFRSTFGYWKPRQNLCAVSNIVYGDTMYSLTRRWIWSDARFDSRLANDIAVANSADVGNIIQKMEGTNSVLFFETIGNGKGMPVLDLENLMRRIWDTDCILVLDNTFLTCALLNPFVIMDCLETEIGHSRTFTFVYVESLSKYYRADTEDHDPGGIIVASEKFIGLCDDELQNGGVMANSVLRKFPFSLFDACSRVMLPLSENASAAADFLRGHPFVEKVWYPDNHPVIQAEAGGQAGGVLYFLHNDVEQGAGKRLMVAGGIPEATSFGHPDTTHIDWSLFGEQFGLVRLAVGFMEEPHEVVAKLEHALG